MYLFKSHPPPLKIGENNRVVCNISHQLVEDLFFFYKLDLQQCLVLEAQMVNMAQVCVSTGSSSTLNSGLGEINTPFRLFISNHTGCYVSLMCAIKLKDTVNALFTKYSRNTYSLVASVAGKCFMAGFRVGNQYMSYKLAACEPALSV